MHDFTMIPYMYNNRYTVLRKSKRAIKIKGKQYAWTNNAYHLYIFGGLLNVLRDFNEGPKCRKTFHNQFAFFNFPCADIW